MGAVKGYKVFNSDWTCRNKQYTCPGEFEEDVDPVCCKAGIHFCIKIIDCFKYYDFDPANRVAEVLAVGEVDYAEGDTKCCTDRIQIIREITWHEVLNLVNTGDYNTGNRNTGDQNTGDWNTGNRNTGDWNTGNRNTGDWNTGDWNVSSFNTGCFMTEEQKIMLFDRLSNWTYKDWARSYARKLLNQIPRDVVEWVSAKDMTDVEKTKHPTYKTTEGYLRILNKDESGQIWWNSLSESDKDVIWNLPNFDSKIFKKCTGITV